jgi:hypothetical protein
MSHDIQGLLAGWEYDPSTVKARWIDGDDGRRKVQLRLDIGVLQMETTGRPDGRSPHGCASLLEFYRGGGRASGNAERRDLGPEACVEIQQEAVQYYHRYLAYSSLRHTEGVIADTDHNLALLDLVRRRAVEPEMAWPLLQFFPYVRMTNARARAERLSAAGRPGAAIEAVESAMEDIRAFSAEHHLPDIASPLAEADSLNDLLVDLRRAQPLTLRDRLERDMADAIAREDFEKAAVLRDELRRIA